ncbi:MAG: tRNA pseudouridine(38-40) synthase TruA [Bacilli bacterium]|nr:tRNA pseudouridine(38-40) synthase TruA [Bacilli bacterium]MBP3635454.1 tRNA pseudouridine(38-40) synthase TruA [Bacilli bacterium]
MVRYLINFSYDGSNYNGYQKQKGLNTIQGKIEEALKSINNGKETKFSSSGRTDAFVHANNQYGHADIDVKITEDKLKRALNSFLPDDIYVKNVKIVSNDFHSRYMVKEKEYVYILNLSEYNAIQRKYVYQFCKKLNIRKMRKALKHIRGTHDFSNLSSNEYKEKNTIRTIYNAKITKKKNYLIFSFIANGFLKYMVRIIVGVLIEVGQSKLNEKDIKKILDGTYKGNYKKVAPPEGLYLNNVKYKKI